MPQVNEIKKLAQELHDKKLINLDSSLSDLIQVEELKAFDKTSQGGGVLPIWNAIFGSGYVLVTALSSNSENL